MKLCKDCKWCGLLDGENTLCFHPEDDPSMVTGEPVVIMKYCKNERQSHLKCGLDADYWEPKDETY